MTVVSMGKRAQKRAKPPIGWFAWLRRIVNLAGSLKRRRESVSRLPDQLKRDIGVLDTTTIRRRR